MGKEYQKFYQNDLWQEAYQLQKQVFQIAAAFPKNEQYGLTSQLNNSSNSVCANIAEENGRFYFADKVRVLYIVRGEIQETQSHLIVSVSRGYISEEKISQLVKQYEVLKRKLNGRIADFIRKKQKS